MDLWVDVLIEGSDRSNFRQDARIRIRLRCQRGDELLWALSGTPELHASRAPATVEHVRLCGENWAKALEPAVGDVIPASGENLLGAVRRVGFAVADLLFPRSLRLEHRPHDTVDVRRLVIDEVNRLCFGERFVVRLWSDPRLGFIPAEFAVLGQTLTQPKPFGDPLAQMPQIGVIRNFPAGPARERAPVSDAEALRILHVTWPGVIVQGAAPDFYSLGEAESELARSRVLEAVEHAKVVHVSATCREALRADLARVAPHILVIGTHGEGPTPRHPSGYISLAQEEVSGEDLASDVKDLDDLHLAVVLACRSGLVNSDGWGVAGSLMEVGLPSVIAMTGRARLGNGAGYLQLVRHVSEGYTVSDALSLAASVVQSEPVPEWYHHALFTRDPTHRLRSGLRSQRLAGSARVTASAFLSPGNFLVGQHDGVLISVPLLLPRIVQATVTVTPLPAATDLGAQVVVTPVSDVETTLADTWSEIAELATQIARTKGYENGVRVQVQLMGVDIGTIPLGAAAASVTATAAAVARAFGVNYEPPRAYLLARHENVPRHWYVLLGRDLDVHRRYRWSTWPRGFAWLIAACDVNQDQLLNKSLLRAAANALLRSDGDPESQLSALTSRFRRNVADAVGVEHRRLLATLDDRNLVAVGQRTIAVLVQTSDELTTLQRRLAAVSRSVTTVREG